MIRIERTCDPRARGDGWRILAERLWPRAMKKDAVAAAPSTEPPRWFDHKVDRWDEFWAALSKGVERELRCLTVQRLLASRIGLIPLYSAHVVRHNGAVVLRDDLIKRQPDRGCLHR